MSAPASTVWAIVVFRLGCFAVGAFLIHQGWVFWPGLIILVAAFNPSKIAMGE